MLKTPLPFDREPSADVSPHHATRGATRTTPVAFMGRLEILYRTHVGHREPRRATRRKTTRNNNVNSFDRAYDAQTVGPVLSETPWKPFQSIKSRKGVAFNAPQN